MEKQFIQQENDHTCALVALMNYVIERDGKCPIKYKSKAFWKLFKECGGSSRRGLEYIYPACVKLKIVEQVTDEIRNWHDLRSLIEKQLKLGKAILISVPNEDCTFHTVLLLKHDEKYSSFKIINGNFLTDESPIEYVPYEHFLMSFYISMRGSARHFTRKEQKLIFDMAVTTLHVIS